MTFDAPQVLAELRKVRALLLTPSQAVLRQCDRRLARVIVIIRRTGPSALPSGIEELLSDIKMLLRNAKDFWGARVGPAAARHYVPGGMVPDPLQRSTFAIEI